MWLCCARAPASTRRQQGLQGPCARAQFACFFLICTTSLLKIRWLLGTAVLTAPLLLVLAAGVLRGVHPFGVQIALADVLPRDADVHLTCAWATGALMSFLADSYRWRGARGPGPLPGQPRPHCRGRAGGRALLRRTCGTKSLPPAAAAATYCLQRQQA